MAEPLFAETLVQRAVPARNDVERPAHNRCRNRRVFGTVEVTDRYLERVMSEFALQRRLLQPHRVCARHDHQLPSKERDGTRLFEAKRRWLWCVELPERPKAAASRDFCGGLLNRAEGIESDMELALHRPAPISPDPPFHRRRIRASRSMASFRCQGPGI